MRGGAGDCEPALVSVRAKLADLARLEAVLSKRLSDARSTLTPVCPLLVILDTAPASLANEGL